MAEKRYAFVIEVDRCIDCKACMIACNVENQVPVGYHRNWVEAAPLQGTFPELAQNLVPGNCLHCQNPPCVQVCPTGASYQRADGLVLIAPDECIGCKYCISACPYQARYFDETRQVVDKCSACAHRLDVGQPPACVETCVGGSRHFGDLNDPNSTVAKLIATGRARPFHPETGTGPHLFYISARNQTDAEFPVKNLVGDLTWFRRDLERPVALGLLGAAIAITGGAFQFARRNALKHFEHVAAENESPHAPQEEPHAEK
ncbi:MAG: 4Fe-4S dicluster domain-containing protein [Anaerolineales bacterium]|nr:4Fe-4S dicluster domain-containing protein [Anaerolineales bacterium]